MELGNLHVRIGRRSTNNQCGLLVRISGLEGQLDFEASIHIPATAPAAPVIPPEVPALIAQRIAGDVQRARSNGAITQLYFPHRLLLEIEPVDLVGLDWEKLLNLTALSPTIVITRFRPVSDMHAVRPFELPLSVLHAPRLALPGTGPSDSVMKYFRYHRVSGINDLDVAPTLRGGSYEVVHLAVDALWRDNLASNLTLEPQQTPPARGISAAALMRAMSACHARLLVLQCIEASSYIAALNFAHQLLERGGPSTIVLQGAITPYLDALYMSVVHDSFADLGWLSRPPIMRAALFHAIAGERVLKLQPLAQRLLRDMNLTAKTGKSLLQLLQVEGPSAEIRFGGAPPRRVPAGRDRMTQELEASLLGHSQAAKRVYVYNYAKESGAWIPMAADRRTQARAADQIEKLQRSTDRAVNVGFIDPRQERRLRPNEALRTNQWYDLLVQIGQRTSWSLIDGNAAFPESAIEGQYSGDVIDLRVLVFAPSFEVKDPDMRLHLGRPPAESEEVRFSLRTPASPGKHRLRVCIYKDLNLLQSVVVRATVSAGAEARGSHTRAITAEVEFALSAAFADVQTLPRRECNFLANATDEGTHTFAVVGGGFKTTFDFEDGEMRGAVGAARDALYQVAADTSSDPPTYRFDPNTNATTVKRLEQDITKLAELGFQLYSNIVTGKDRPFAEALRKSLGPAGATIQIAAVKSARYVFPWSLVYDHPLVTGSLRLCSQFAADAARMPPQSLATQQCLVQGCPNLGKTDIVCPSGFWGFKHLIEQPLSVDTQPSASGKCDLVLEIDGGQLGSDVSALMVVSRELTQVVMHEKELLGSSLFVFQIRDTKVEACESLKDPQRAAHLVYFYCHGGREKARTWLGIGKGVQERLVPGDLTGLQIDWTDIHPLIFINGCHTADFTTDDLLNFNQVLSYCRAAGVIGTEISVPEELARFFAFGFLRNFRNGISVGTAMRAQRLALLERCNLLGLAYTPYCSVDLKVVQH